MQAKFTLWCAVRRNLLQHDLPKTIFLCNRQMRIAIKNTLCRWDKFFHSFFLAVFCCPFFASPLPLSEVFAFLWLKYRCVWKTSLPYRRPFQDIRRFYLAGFEAPKVAVESGSARFLLDQLVEAVLCPP